MITLNLVQGSQEWHEVRAKSFAASEAPAMMSVSKYMKRSELLKQKATGVASEVTPAQQRIFDKGHAAEASARPIAEKIIGDELFPATGQLEETSYLSSFDGITMMEDVIWEHKLINNDLRNATAETLGEHYKIQMDQQLMVSGASKCLFMASDGTEENCNYFWYETTDERKQALVSGWQQFQKDLKAYQPEEAKPEAVADIPESLPSLFADVVGEVKSTNLATFKDIVLDRIRSIKTDLVTDNDFATAEATVKFFTKAEKELESAKDRALSQTASIDDLFKTIDHLKEEMRTKRLALNKQVKDRKEQIRADILLEAKHAFVQHINAINSELGGFSIQPVAVDFAGAIKGKKTISSLQSAIDDEMARAKIEDNQSASEMSENVATLKEMIEGLEFLFSDSRELVLLGNAHLKAEIKTRIAEHKHAEEERLKAERERIRLEEEAKAKAKAEAEAKEKERARIAAEMKAKAEAEAEALAKQEAVTTADPVAEQAPHFVMPVRGAKEEQQAMPFGTPEIVAADICAATTEMITIPRDEYDALLADRDMLDALKAAGVDNWAGYSEAIEMIKAA